MLEVDEAHRLVTEPDTPAADSANLETDTALRLATARVAAGQPDARPVDHLTQALVAFVRQPPT